MIVSTSEARRCRFDGASRLRIAARLVATCRQLFPLLHNALQSSPQVAEVKQKVASTLDTCFQLARLQGPDMEELISANVEGCASSYSTLDGFKFCSRGEQQSPTWRSTINVDGCASVL